MNKINIYIVLLISVYLISCGAKPETQTEETAASKTPVEVVPVNFGSIHDELTLFGTTIFLNKNLVNAPIASFISKVHIRLGDKVHKGDLLFVLESKESRALGNDISKMDSTISNFGIVKINASATGIISTLDKQQAGDYVLEGTQLCTIAESNDLVFQINVPYEYTIYTKTGNACSILLPDDNKLTATFFKALPTMNAGAQTQTILARSNKNILLPENMVVKALIQKDAQDSRQVLPKSCVLSDEMMHEFWVMTLINDSTAIKTPVSIGNKNAALIEIVAPTFKSTDRIISVGNYGLPDTALVSISKEGAK